MVSLEEEFDMNWVCCLLNDATNTCCDSYVVRSNVPLPTRLNSSPCSNSYRARTQDSSDVFDDGLEECCRKRVCVGSVTASSSKACREKQRRDHLNRRFLELSAILESRTAPKLDKAAILTDAIRTLKLLREETSSLTSQNSKLKQKINELKVEKNELRAEKRTLVSEKQKVEQRIRSLGACPSWQLHPTSVPNSYSIPCQAIGSKLMPLVNYSNSPLWQYVPQAAFDTSQDHVLRPPIA